MKMLTKQSTVDNSKALIEILKDAVERDDLETGRECLANLLNIEIKQIIWNNENPKAERLNLDLFREQILDTTNFRKFYTLLLTSEEGRHYKELKHPKIIRTTRLLKRLPSEYERTHEYIASLGLSVTFNYCYENRTRGHMLLAEKGIINELKERTYPPLLMSARDAGALIKADKMLTKFSSTKTYHDNGWDFDYTPRVDVTYYRMKSSQNKV